MGKYTADYKGKRITVDGDEGMTEEQLLPKFESKYKQMKAEDYADEAWTSVLNGATFGLGNRIVARISSLNPNVTYEEAKKKHEKTHEDFAKKNPKMDIAANIAGSTIPMLLTGGAGGAAGGIKGAGALWKLAKTGAIIGGVSSGINDAAQSDDLLSTDALKRLAVGGAKGVAIGAVTAPLIGLGVDLGKKGINFLTTTTKKGLARKAIDKLGKSVETKTPLLETANESGEINDIIHNAAHDSPIANKILNKELKNTKTGQVNDLNEILNKKFGDKRVLAAIKSVDAEGNDIVNAAYEKAYKIGVIPTLNPNANTAVLNKELQQVRNAQAPLRANIASIEEQFSENPELQATLMKEITPELEGLVDRESLLLAQGAEGDVAKLPYVSDAIKKAKEKYPSLSLKHDNDIAVLDKANQLMRNEYKKVSNRSGAYDPLAAHELRIQSSALSSVMKEQNPLYKEATELYIAYKVKPNKLIQFGHEIDKLTPESIEEVNNLLAENPNYQKWFNAGVRTKLEDTLNKIGDTESNIIEKVFPDNVLRNLKQLGYNDIKEAFASTLNKIKNFTTKGDLPIGHPENIGLRLGEGIGYKRKAVNVVTKHISAYDKAKLGSRTAMMLQDPKNIEKLRAVAGNKPKTLELVNKISPSDIARLASINVSKRIKPQKKKQRKLTYEEIMSLQ